MHPQLLLLAFRISQHAFLWPEHNKLLLLAAFRSSLPVSCGKSSTNYCFCQQFALVQHAVL